MHACVVMRSAVPSTVATPQAKVCWQHAVSHMQSGTCCSPRMLAYILVSRKLTVLGSVPPYVGIRPKHSKVIPACRAPGPRTARRHKPPANTTGEFLRAVAHMLESSSRLAILRVQGYAKRRSEFEKISDFGAATKRRARKSCPGTQTATGLVGFRWGKGKSQFAGAQSRKKWFGTRCGTPLFVAPS